jgi:hypothetical protein
VVKFPRKPNVIIYFLYESCIKCKSLPRLVAAGEVEVPAPPDGARGRVVPAQPRAAYKPGAQAEGGHATRVSYHGNHRYTGVTLAGCPVKNPGT